MYFDTNDTTQPKSWVWLGYQTRTIAFGPETATDPSLPVQYQPEEIGLWPINHQITYLSSGEISQVTYDDPAQSIYAATGAIRHDPVYGPSYKTRGLPSVVRRWYDLTQDLSVAATMKYDECGNVREIRDPRLNTTYTEYWLSAADNAYAFPLRVTNPLVHQVNATYSYRSGVPLTRTDSNGKVTTIQYDTRDRVVQVQKPSGGKKFIVYSDRAFCQDNCSPGDIPHADITEEITSTTSRESSVQVDVMGRIDETTIIDGGGNIKTNTSYDAFQRVDQVERYREGQSSAVTDYSYIQPGYLGNATAPDNSWVGYSYDRNYVTTTADNGFRRRYSYQEDGKVNQVREEDGNNQLNVDTNYAYDTMGRLLTIAQRVQTRTFTYDALGRLKSETHPENGTTAYTYDANSNLLTRTDARGITTTYVYDDLNRVTLKSYSHSTPSVSYFYDSQPGRSPIAIQNPVGRLTRITTTTSGVTVTNYYSYCNCSSIEREATVITDGSTRTYITSYAYNYLGGLTSIIYPNGKIVTYTRDDVGRETKVSSTVVGQNIDYIRSASYLGPSGQLSQFQYGIRYQAYGSWLATLYSYSPKTLRLTFLQTHGLRETLQYGTPNNPAIQTGHIYDIIDGYDSDNNKHFVYDRWYRLTSYRVSPGRNDPFSRRLDWTYDGNNNIASIRDYNNPGNCPEEGCLDAYNVDSATNRLTSIVHYTLGQWASWYTFDAAGNDITGGRTFDAENRLTSAPPLSYLYDGNSRRLRILQGGSKTYYIYSAGGLLLVEDNWTEAAVKNQIYFSGQVIATHDQADYVRFLIKDHLGSIRSMVEVTPGGQDWTKDWFTINIHDYDPFGGMYGYYDFTHTSYNYTGKLKDVNGLHYYGARYYLGAFGYSRWVSADPVMGRPYDPPSLNKYAYVRNDPINFIDPDGKMAAPLDGQLLDPVMRTLWSFSEDEEGEINGVLIYSYIDFIPRGGGSGKPVFRVQNRSKVGANQDRIVAVLNEIKSDIDPDCARWLGDVSGTIESLLGDSSNPDTVFVAHGVFDRANVAAFTGTAGTDLPAGYAALVVNDNGGFFRNNDLGTPITVAGYGGGTAQAQALIMLHELAHILNAAGFRQNDFGNDNAVAANNDMVKSHCAKTINAFK